MTVRAELSSESLVVTSAATPNEMIPVTAITRRSFVKIGGALFVSFAAPAGLSALVAGSNTQAHASLDPKLIASWLKIRHNKTIWRAAGARRPAPG